MSRESDFFSTSNKHLIKAFTLIIPAVICTSLKARNVALITAVIRSVIKYNYTYKIILYFKTTAYLIV